MEWFQNLVHALQGFTGNGLSTFLAHVPLAVVGVGVLYLFLVFPFLRADARADVLKLVRLYVDWAKVARGK